MPDVPLDDDLKKPPTTAVSSDDAQSRVSRGNIPLTMSQYMSPLGSQPKREMEHLKKCVNDLWSGNIEVNTFRDISDMLRLIERATCKKFDNVTTETSQKPSDFDTGDLTETLNVIHELKDWMWLWRVPSLVLTVVIACFCIPMAATLEHVIVDNPILGGFPPAISAAAGCVGIQNTAIVIRGMGLKLIKPSWTVFGKFAFISFTLSLFAAIVEAIVAWIVVSFFSSRSGGPIDPSMFINDVPAVIFLSMLLTGFLAGICGSGVPLLVTWAASKTGLNLDPAHWVGPIETVVQEFCATLATFGLADIILVAASHLR